MPKQKIRPKSPPTSRQLDAVASKIVKEIVDASRNGDVDYIAAVNNNEVSLADLFDKTFSLKVRNRVYRQLLLEEQALGSATCDAVPRG